MKKHMRWILLYLSISASVLAIAVTGSGLITVMSENAPLTRSYVIVIDAGHGGEDGGSSSLDGIFESTYNLSIALRLEKMLHFLGVETRMVRNQDVSVYTEGSSLREKKRSDLKERVKLVNETSNSILLSIHQNSYPDSQYHGAQIFYADTAGSKFLAADVQSAIHKALDPQNKREIKSAKGIYLMEHIHRPGILIECGFLSNPQEAQLLRSSEYQKKLACVIAASVKAHMEAVSHSRA